MKSPLRGAPLTIPPSPNSPKNIPPRGAAPRTNVTSGGGGGGGAADCPTATVAASTARTITAIGLGIPNFMEFISSTSSRATFTFLIHDPHGSHQTVIPDDHVGYHRLTSVALARARANSAPGQFHANDLLFA